MQAASQINLKTKYKCEPELHENQDNLRKEVKMKVYEMVKIKDLPSLSKAHQYVLKARLSLQGRKRALEARGEEFGLDWLIEIFVNLEVDLERLVKDTFRQHILYPELKRIKGSGDELMGKLIGWIEGVEQRLCPKCGAIWEKKKNREEEIGEEAEGETKVEWYPSCNCPEAKASYITRTGIACFDTVSQFRSFVGWGRPERKTAGSKTRFNPELKAHCWKLANSFIKAKGRLYREYYLPAREKEAGKFQIVKAQKGKVKELPPGVTTKLHVHLRATRKMLKAFLGGLYYSWRMALGLPCRPTYPQEYLGHTGKCYTLEDFYDN